MSTTLHESNSGIVIGILKHDLIWDQLIMETRLGQSSSGSHALIDGVDDVLDCGCDDPTSSCGTGDKK